MSPAEKGLALRFTNRWLRISPTKQGHNDAPARPGSSSRSRHAKIAWGRSDMNELLAKVIAAHGGAELWAGLRQVEATIVSGGGFFALKGIIQDDDPRRITVALHEQRVSMTPYGAADQRSVFTAERVAVEKTDGSVLAERPAPKDSFAGHQMNTPWDALQRAYFNGEALWTYLTT